MKKRILSLALCCIGFHLSAQLPDLEVKSEYSKQNQLVIKSIKRAPGTFFLEINFSGIENSLVTRDELTKVITSASTDVLTLEPSNKEQYPTARYSYRYWPGNPECKPDTSFVYRLPYSPNLTRKVSSLHLIGSSFASRTNINWHSMQFSMEPNDTVYAVRAGTVTRIETAESEKQETASSGRTTYKANVNQLTVEHADGTYATYSVLENVWIQKGDRVYPDTPLGTAGSYDGKYYQVRLMIFYYRIAPKKPGEKTNMEYHYFSPVFATTEGEKKLTMHNTYSPVVTNDLILKEMTKREIKKYSGK